MGERIKLKSLGAVGARVEDINLSQVTPDQLNALKQAFADHEVLFCGCKHSRRPPFSLST